MRLILPSIVLLAIFALPGVAAADAWSMPGFACRPRPADLDRYEETGLGVTFKGNATGYVQFRCPVTGFGNFQATKIGITYRDSDPSSNNYVAAFLYEISKGANSGFIVGQIFSSSDCSGTDVHYCERDLSLNSFDFDNNYYFVSVHLYRLNSGASETFYAVHLREQ